jgi:CspA family cold shock protein
VSSKERNYREPRRRGFDDDHFGSGGGGGGGSGRGGPFGGHDAAPRFPASRPQPQAPSGPPIDAVVKWFNPEKGFGFVELSDGTGDAFLHIAVLETKGYKAVAPGAKLSVKAGMGHKGQQVFEVLSVDESTATEQARTFAPRGGPRHLDTSNSEEMEGVVKWYNQTKGFGFVSVADGGKDVFVHAKALQRSGLMDLVEGQPVKMTVVQGLKGREALRLTLG